MDGAFRIKGVCDVCNVNAFFNGVGCQCLPGYLGNGKICRQDPKFFPPSLSTSSVSNTDSKNTSSTNSQS